MDKSRDTPPGRARTRRSFRGVRAAGSPPWLIAAPHPDHLWRRPPQRRKLGEVRIERDERVTVGTSELPERAVICLGQSEKPGMTGVWEEISKLPAELEAQVLIEQELHLRRHQAALAIGGIGEAGEDIAFCQFGVFIEDLLVRHPCGEPAKDVGYGDSHSPDTGTAAALAKFDCYNLVIVHIIILLAILTRGQHV